MKKLLFVFAWLITAVSAKSQTDNMPGEMNGMVTYISSTPGTVTVSSTGFSRKMKGSVADAAAGAVYTLMFRGVAGSPYNLPMVPDEASAQNLPAVKALMDGGYKAFLTENTLTSKEKKKKKNDGVKGQEATYRITINCDALRRHLEQNGVIRKFGI